MNTLLKNMMLALLALGIGQAVWAYDVPDFQETLQAAEQGNAQAQFNLGWMYANGEGVRQDPVQAVQWYRKAAEQGLGNAQYNLRPLQKSPSSDNRNPNTGFRLFSFQISTDSTQTPP